MRVNTATVVALVAGSLLLAQGCFLLGNSRKDAASEDTLETRLQSETPPLAVKPSGESISRIWANNCASCHGDRGQGGGAGTPSLLTRALFDQIYDKPFYDAIKDGVPEMGMEAFGASLSETEIWGLVVHIRELQFRALRNELRAPKAENGVIKTQRENYRIETVIDTDQGLRTPWAIAWLPDGATLVTNRSGTVTVFDRDGKRIGNIQNLPQAQEFGQGGMMEVAVHPDYSKNGWIYLGFSEASPGGGPGTLTRIVRGKLDRNGGELRWTNQQNIWQADPKFYTRAGVHFGTRIVFDGKGHLFFAIGDRGNMRSAQDRQTPNGTIFRLNEDGSLPKDNPFPDAPAVWSYGHRNPQGLTFDLEGNLWATEHGPRGGDELNHIVRGANYGWPEFGFSINYNDQPFHTPWPRNGQDFAMPVLRWIPSIAACGLDVARGSAFPNWRGDLLAGGLAGETIERVRVRKAGSSGASRSDEPGSAAMASVRDLYETLPAPYNPVMATGFEVVETEAIFSGHGRVRDVRVGPDGFVYVVLNSPDKVVRLVPAIQ
jgi:glucose/arabinose dehydrogenase